MTNIYNELFYREVTGILQHQWFERPILPTKHPKRRELFHKIFAEW